MRERLQSHLVGLLGVGCFACGFIAEATRPKRDDISLQAGECMYPTNPAFMLGFVAAALLLLAVALITGCCGCCCKRRNGVSTMNFTAGIVCAVISWLIALDAGLILMLSSVANLPGRHGKAPECYDYLHADHFFARGATQAMLAIFFGICSDKLLRKGAKDPDGPADI